MFSNHQNFQFKKWSGEKSNTYLKTREGEIKIGEEFCSLEDSKFVILGIEESIGPKANLGNSGAENGFDAFCAKFFNLQSNRFLNGNNISFLGNVELTSEFKEPEYRLAVDELDEFVTAILRKHLQKHQVPIIIGGGHNNAYPIIRFVSKMLGKKVNIVNLDAHADYRIQEGRHSGNPFSYAFADGYINKYKVIGLHQSYNSEENLNRLKKDGHEYLFLEDILDGIIDWKECLNSTRDQLIKEELPVGLELDLDAIQMMPSSASSPFGVDFKQARQYVRTLSQMYSVKYFHLPEGAPSSSVEENQVGKAMAILVSDFIGAQNQLNT